MQWFLSRYFFGVFLLVLVGLLPWLVSNHCRRLGLRDHCKLVLGLKWRYVELVCAAQWIIAEQLSRLGNRVVARNNAILSYLCTLRLNRVYLV